MAYARFRKFLPIFIIIALVISLMTPRVAFADDSLPADTPTEQTFVSDAPVEAEASTDASGESTEAPAEETAAEAVIVEEPAVEVTQAVAEALAEIVPSNTEEAVAEDDVAAEATPIEAEAEAAAPEVAVIDEPVEALPQVVEALSEVDAVIINEDGETVSLASADVAEALQGADPFYTYGGTTYRFLPTGGNCAAFPGDVCTTSATPIQAAIDHVGVTVPSGTPVVVNVEAGTYNEAVTINVSGLTLRGANAAIDPNTGVRGPESVIVAPTSSWYGIYIEADDVTIEGFTLTNEATTDGEDDYLIAAYNSNNLTLANNIFVDFGDMTDGDDDFGAILWNSGTPTDATITNNLFDGGDRAIYSGWDAYADITNNTITNIIVGIEVENNWQADPDGSATISNNTIDTTRYGIWDNLQYGTATPYTIEDNTITGTAGTDTRPTYGIYVTSIQGNASAELIDNNVTGTDIGIGLWNDPSNLVTITGGTLSDNVFGIQLDNDSYPVERGQDPSGAASTVTVDDVTIVNASGAAFYVRDNDDNDDSPTPDLHLNVDNSTVICSASIGTTEGTGGFLSVTNTDLISVDDPVGTGLNISQSNNTISSIICNPPPPTEPSTPPTTEPSSPTTPPPLPNTLIPVTGDEFVNLDCNIASVFTLQLENKDKALFTCNVGGKVGLIGELEDLLPDVVPDGTVFVGGMTTSVLNGVVPVTTLPSGASITVEFLVPTALAGQDLAILYWDESANENLGGWVELEDPILQEGYLLKTVSFTGTFVLVTK